METVESNIAAAGQMMFNIMDSTGHSKHIFDKSKPDEVEAARVLFNSLKEKRYQGFYVDKEGNEGTRMTDFDPKAGTFIMVPPVVGG